MDPYEWYKRFISSRIPFSKGFGDIFREFDDMKKEMEMMFESVMDIEKNTPKELVREYETQDGRKVREVGPIVYGYSMTIGSDGKSRIREFGNIHPSAKGFGLQGGREISAEREAITDISSTNREVKVIVEMPGVRKEDIKINAYDGVVEIATDDPKRKYYQVIELPPEVNMETARSTYNNGILEITFDKLKDTKPKGKEIKVE